MVALFGAFIAYLIGLRYEFKKFDQEYGLDEKTRRYREWAATPDGRKYQRRITTCIGLAITFPLWMPLVVAGILWSTGRFN